MNISKRLRHVASYIDDNSNIIDVACDHALLDIYLYLTKKNMKITVSDIAKLPLESARQNLLNFNIKDIKVKLGDGISTLTDEDTVVITGLGGKTIIDILKKDLKKLIKVKKIVLCPNDHFYLIRKELVKLGYMIEKEELVEDNKKIYLIISFIRGNKHYKINELFFGKDINKDIVFNKYYDNMLKKELYKLNNIPHKYFLKRFKNKLLIHKLHKYVK
ncbi:MAG: class I SAM-dependent methyltransferase [Bacilli bacterium]